MTETHGAAWRPGQLSIGHTAVDPLVTGRGEIDHPVKDMLSQALLSTTARRRRGPLWTSAATFMDSSGIDVLIAAHRSMRDAHGWLRLAGPRHQCCG
ncbi:STAS domain-containing protein [Streptomyces sp. AC555_RSS877]|uniref:STAS domain-containing protein n=1 Tax=Streptomyces sp. AC555_RSS877 TaxID=2823688 RepID=UPI0035ABC5F3